MSSARLSPKQEKALSNFEHAAKRGLERFGLVRHEIREIEQMVKTSGSNICFLKFDMEFKNRSWVAVFYGNAWIPVVWDCATNSIVTILPESAILDYSYVLRERTPRPQAAVAEPVEMFDFIKGIVAIPERPHTTTKRWCDSALDAISKRNRQIQQAFYERQVPSEMKIACTEEVLRLSRLKKEIKAIRHKEAMSQ